MNNINYFFTRDGNKLKELKYFNSFLPAFNSFNVYVEPYAGSFGTLRGIHQHLQDNDIKIHINDMDRNMIEQWQWILTEDIKKVELVVDMFNTYFYSGLYVSGNSEGKQIYNAVFNELKAEGIPDLILKEFRESCAFMGIIKGSKKMTDFLPVRELLKKCTITRMDAVALYEEYKNNPHAFLFLDPPYLDTSLKYYGDTHRREDLGGKMADNSIHYIKMLEMLETAQCKIMAVINKTYLTTYLFSRFIKHEYNKTYQRTRTKTVHIVITNY